MLWIRIHLPVEGTQVQSLDQEDSTCFRVTKLVCHDYWAHWSPWHLDPISTTRQAVTVRAPSTATKNRPCSLKPDQIPHSHKDPVQPNMNKQIHYNSKDLEITQSASTICFMCVSGIQGWQGEAGLQFHAFYRNHVCVYVGPLPVLWKGWIALWVQTWRQSFTPPWIHSWYNLILQLLQYRGRICSSPLTLTWPCDFGQELTAEVTVCQVPA